MTQSPDEQHDQASADQASADQPKKSGLGTRIASAALMIPIAVAAAWVGGAALGLLVALACAAMAKEWSGLTAEDANLATAHVAIPTTVGMVMAGFGWFEAAIGALVVGVFMSPLLPAKDLGPKPYASAIGIIYIGFPALSMMALRGDDLVGIALILWLLGVVAFMDTGAYFSGKTIGGPKLAPRLSPNKTWAGLVGGMVAAGAFGALFPTIALQTGLITAEEFGFIPGGYLTGFGMGAVLGAISQAGDIMESSLKRRAGVKDASNLIPGHGGVLDRVDGMLFAAPVLWLFIYVTTGRII